VFGARTFAANSEPSLNGPGTDVFKHVFNPGLVGMISRQNPHHQDYRIQRPSKASATSVNDWAGTLEVVRQFFDAGGHSRRLRRSRLATQKCLSRFMQLRLRPAKNPIIFRSSAKRVPRLHTFAGPLFFQQHLKDSRPRPDPRRYAFRRRSREVELLRETSCTVMTRRSTFSRRGIASLSSCGGGRRLCFCSAVNNACNLFPPFAERGREIANPLAMRAASNFSISIGFPATRVGTKSYYYYSFLFEAACSVFIQLVSGRGKKKKFGLHRAILYPLINTLKNGLTTSKPMNFPTKQQTLFTLSFAFNYFYF